METVAACMSKKPQEIYDIAFVGRHPITHASIREPLWREAQEFVRAGASSHMATGHFEISSSRFPRVYRTVKAICSLECQLGDPNPEHSLPVINLDASVTNGTSSIEWFQLNPEPRLNLRLELTGMGTSHPIDIKVVEVKAR